MSLSTYAGLRVAIANVLKRSDLVADIPDLITLAEAQMNQRLDLRQQDTTTTIATVAGTATVTLPSGVIAIRALQITSPTPYVTLDYVTPEYLREMYASAGQSRPEVYTTYGLTAVLAPIPDGIYTLTATYKSTITALSDSNTTNFVLTAYPDVYLYGALANAGPYINDPARVSVWQASFERAIAGANFAEWHTGSPMTVRNDSFNP